MGIVRAESDGPRVSLVIPVRNEEQSLPALVRSIALQTRPPDELLLVDGGSADRTVALARELLAGDPRFRILEVGDATPGRGRNAGIAAASHEWIALTDAGIRLEPDWLERLCGRVAHDPELDVVYGNCQPVTETFFERCAALAYAPRRMQRGDAHVRGPSVASMLLRRSVWRAVGGFPDLRAAEDLIFMERIERERFRVGWCPEATVHWQLQNSLGGTFRRFALYSKHNVWAGRQADWHYGIARMYLAALPFVLLAIFHSGWWALVPLLGAVLRVGKSIWQRSREFGGSCWNPVQFGLVGLILLTIDAATIMGWIAAHWRSRPAPFVGMKASLEQEVL